MAASASSSSSSTSVVPKHMDTLKDLTREKFLDIMQSVEPAEGHEKWKVLLVDDETTTILGSGCGMFNLIEAGVSLCEPIKNRREPLPSMEAIYLLSPTEESVQHLINDYDLKYDPKRNIYQYAAAHLFFTSRLPAPLFQRLTEAGARKMIKSLKEINLRYWVYESQVFHLQMPDVFQKLYGPDQSRRNTVYRNIAQRLATVCCTFGQQPFIRYDAASPHAKGVANMLQKTVADVQSLASDAGDQRPLFLIVDRSLDAVSPLLHEVTYQAMAMDLLKVDHKTTDQFQYEYTDNSGDVSTRTAILLEDDVLWNDLRHMHVFEAIKKVVAMFNAFVKENRKAGNLATGRVKSLKEMGEALRAQPQYQDMLSKYSLHVNMTDACTNEFKKRQLQLVGQLEQVLVHGTGGKKLLNELRTLLMGEVRDGDKRRLVQLTALCGLMKEAISLNDADIKAGDLEQIVESMGTRSSPATEPSPSSSSKSKKKSKKVETPDSFTPRLKHLLEDLLGNHLSTDEFPFTNDVVPKDLSNFQPVPATEEFSKKKKTASRSLKSGAQLSQPTWASKRASQGKSKGKLEALDKPNVSGRRIVVFVVGGTSYAEVRSVYELTRDHRRQITLGSTEIMWPDLYSERLSQLAS
eukprot:CAMPEP_0174230262 /NCGR_PEP_ID=MMETSP0417-20130205/1056_1 /TAXON_ID=242541 /ORGANISM="Mayorella sp, Strain BSH-02190019" /LENGTH=634 /DNA_ID=CAMNT_0015307913 /DNA_START=89 /DNA_END=1993 /DNA_ORIENTATION=-